MLIILQIKNTSNHLHAKTFIYCSNQPIFIYRGIIYEKKIFNYNMFITFCSPHQQHICS